MTHLRVFEPAFESFESLFKRLMAPMRFEGESRVLELRVDLSEKDKAYTVRADLPGVKKEDIDGNIVQMLPKKTTSTSKKLTIQ